MQQHQQRDQNDDRGAKGGALVEEAKKLMADDDDDQPAARGGEDDGAPKIKMGKIGKKKSSKTSAAQGSAAAASENYTKKISAPIEKSGGGQGGAFNENDIEFMKKAIQILCQSTNPLGKSIDYVTDDVESMSKEYEHWRKEAIHCTQGLEE